MFRQTPQGPARRWHLSLLIAVVGWAWSGAAQAEEEVRISIVSGPDRIRVSGEGLAIYNGESGRMIMEWKGSAEATIARSGKNVLILAGASKKRVGRVRRVLVEAKEAVGVQKGVYFGRVEILPSGRGLLAINRLPLETYLLGIVGSEMSPRWPIESLKAQAVAARTYAMQRRMMMRAANKRYDLASSVLSQVYKGAERIRPSVIRAVRETRGEVLAYRHNLVEALFHSTCGGKTVAAHEAFGNRVPYLKPKTCEWCRPSSRFRWRVNLPISEVSNRLRRAGLTKSKLTKFERGNHAHVVATNGRKRYRLPPREVRKALGFSKLYSSRFTAKTKSGRVHVHGRGFGHGVGMCQWGARGMALEGKSYREILTYYYSGASVRPMY